MSGLIPRRFIDDLLVRVDIVDFIDSQLPLKKNGSNFVARCPFHTEKSPSFSVSRKNQFYHCFGCGVSGNAISFAMEFSHLSFVEAIEELANFVGVDVPRETGHHATVPKDNLKAHYQLLEQVAQFYAKQLRASNPIAEKAVNYLKARGVTGQIAKTFMLGYAQDSWQVLSAVFPIDKLRDIGMIASNDNGKQYDRFRGRIMFPIRDKRGRVIGFGGRVLDDSQPKYLNSPETSVFSKGQNIYGLYEMLRKNTKPVRILVVEGYLDVISLAQFGIDYAVATLGTATTKMQIDLLFSFAAELVFCFDGDNAGNAAAWKATLTALPSLRDGRQIRIMLLPATHDPDSLIRAEGLENFVQRVSSAQALSEYFFNQLLKNLDLQTLEGRAALVKNATPYIEQLPTGVFREMMAARLQQLAQSAKPLIVEKPATPPVVSSKPAKKSAMQRSSARVAIVLLLQNPQFAELVADKFIQWHGLDSPGLNLFKGVLQTILNQHPSTTGMVMEIYRGYAEEKVLKKLVSWGWSFPEEGIEEQFLVAVEQMTAQAKELKIDYLLKKATQQDLSTAEKIHLSQLLSR